MEYKIAFFTENNFDGKLPRNHPNARTDMAWMLALDAVHYSLSKHIFWDAIGDKRFDIGILIVPKNADVTYDLDKIKNVCRYVGLMQEGPNWLWQDWPLQRQASYFNLLQDVDFIFCHNKSDVNYYKGLVNIDKPISVMPTLMVLDSLNVKNITSIKDRSGVMIGGNMTSWYGGFDSLVVASEFETDIYAPSMGRKQSDEELYFPNVSYTNYKVWNEWIYELSKRKYAVHLMRTHAAGTFALNCSYLHVPCIGYAGLNCQEDCHPLLTVDMGDLMTAKKLAKRLLTDNEFYEQCSYDCKIGYNEYIESEFLHKMKMRFDNIIKE